MDDSSVGPRRTAASCIAFVSSSEAGDGPLYVPLHAFLMAYPDAVLSQNKKRIYTVL